MDGIIMEWGGMLLRWVHIITGIAWIGSSFYFMHIDAALRATPEIPKEKGGEAWEIHGGGFYHVRKYLVAPEKLPDELIWHKWESYSTWVSGFFLLVWVYYVSADVYLIDPAVRQISPWLAATYGIGGLVLGWIVYDQLCRSVVAKSDLALAVVGFAFIILMAFLYQQVFSARGAFIHTGALMATMMTGNVALVIIPNQYKVIDSLIKGEKPDPALGKTGKQRSTHNNYLTLPVLFLMISGHYPLSYSSPHAYVVIGLVLVAGAVVRHFYNERHAGRGNHWWAWLVAALAMWTAIWISMPQTSAGRETLGLSDMKLDTPIAGLPKAPEKIAEIVSSRCAMCHAQQPVWPGISIAPKGVRLDHPEFVQRYREEIRMFAGLTRAMPPNNLTGMTDEERALIRAWGRTRAAQD